MGEWKETFSQAWGTVASSFDQGVKTLASTLASGTATVEQEASKLRESADDLTSTVGQEAKKAEGLAISYLKDGLRIASENEAATAAAGAVLLVVAVPGIRRFFIRQTAARFRSEEGRFRSAELKLQQLNQQMEQQGAATRKLEERLGAAQSEYDRGLAKLQAAGQRLLSLSKELRASEADARHLVSELRQLPSRQALQLRSEVASKAADINKQRSVVERHISKLLKQGMV